MSRFKGVVGLRGDPVETKPGIFVESISERVFRGELRNNNVRWRSGELAQDSVSANHVVSIIGPESLLSDFSGAVYVVWQSRKWTVKSMQYIRPRLNLTLGDLYNG